MPKHVRSGISVVLGFTAALTGCSTSSSPPSNSPSTPAAPAAGATGAGVTAKVVHTHPTLKTPSFVWLDATAMQKAPGATPVDVATGALHAVAPALKLSDAVLKTAQVSAVHDVGRGAIITSFRQSVEGIDVFHSQLNVAMSRDLAPVSMTGSLAPSLRKLVPGGWSIDERAAVAKAFTALTKLPVSVDGMVANGVDAGGYDRLIFAVKGPKSGTLTRARAKKVWFPNEHGLTAAWYVELDVANDKNSDSMVHAYVVHGGNGSALFDANMTAADSYSYRVWADNTGPHGIAPQDNPYGNGTTPSPYTSYNANATEPPFVAASLVTLANVSGFKQAATDFWLPSNAAELSGNNVHAYADLVAPDGYTPNSIDRLVAPTAPGVFDRIWDPTSFPNGSNDNIDAVTTDLFFVVNYMHDLFYDSGYDEASGNAQANNYNRGGVGGDAVNAESQDYSGINNANCSTPADGSPPRIQMYLWNTTSLASVSVNTPGIVTKSPITNAGATGFGPLATGWDVTGDLVLFQDSTGGGNTGCSAASNDLTGKIAVISRGDGTCVTAPRGEAAAAAGAIGLLMYWTDDTTVPPSIGSDTNLPNFPGNIIGKTDGTAIVNALKANTTVNVTLHKDKPRRDGSVDGTIMSHEWGHSLSNRLIGNGSGLGNQQGGGMGEGWSDFVALLTYIRETDLQVASNANWQGAYPEGAYADGGFPTDLYYGIRRYPYSNDMGKNPYTFKYISNGQDPPASPPPAFWNKASNNEVHNVGEIWTTMLWDCYVGLLQDTTNYTFATAGQAMRDYLVASLKLTPPSPTMVEARDAVLAAALANKAKPNDLVTFAKAFARRGLGTGAIAPDAGSSDLTGVTESFVTGNDIELVNVSLTDDVTSCDNDGVLDEGEVGSLTVKMRNSGIGTLSMATAHVSSTVAGVSFPGGDTLTFPATPAFGTATVKFNIRLDGTTSFTSLPIQIDLNGENLVAVPKAGPRSSSATFYANYDFKAASSATDNVDAPDTTWVTSHEYDPQYGVAGDWERIQTLDGSFGGLWFGVDATAESDQRITSPDLVVGSGAFSFTFKHFYAFETDTSNPSSPVYFDGGVVEISADGGATWTDLGPKMTANGYTGQIYPGTDDLTPISGRQAFVGVTSNFPTASIVTKVDLGTDYAGKTVKVRFRTGSDLGGSAVGWFVDDIAFTGITNTPFASRIDNATACYAPLAKIGADQTVNEGAAVTVDGSGSSVGPGKTITYQWSQIAGPSVALSSTTTAKVLFTAPQVSADTAIKFQLVVSDGKNKSVPAVTTITVKDVGGGGGGSGGTGGHGGTGSGGTGGTGGGGHGGCSTAGDNVPASSALPLLALALLGLVLRRRLS